MTLCSGWPSTGGNNAIIPTDTGPSMWVSSGSDTIAPGHLFSRYRYDGFGAAESKDSDLTGNQYGSIAKWSYDGTVMLSIVHATNILRAVDSTYKIVWDKDVTTTTYFRYRLVMFHNSSKVLLVGYDQGSGVLRLYIIDYSNGSTLAFRELSGIHSQLFVDADIRHDDSCIALAYKTSTASNGVWILGTDLSTITSFFYLSSSNRYVIAVRFNVNGNKLLCVYNPGYSISTATYIFDTGTWGYEPTDQLQFLNYNATSIVEGNFIEISENGRYLILLNGNPGEGGTGGLLIDCSKAAPREWTVLHDFSTGIGTRHPPVNTIHFTPDSKYVLLGCGLGYSFPRLVVWDIVKGEYLSSPTSFPDPCYYITPNRLWR